MQPFNFLRRIPHLVLLAMADQPLVYAAPRYMPTVEVLREDFCDAEANAARRAGLCGIGAYTMTGGEPYSLWA